VNAAIDATVTVISSTLSKKVERFDATPADLGNLLLSSGSQAITTQIVATAITAETLQGLSGGTVSASDVVSDTADVSAVQMQIVTFATDNPGQVDGDVTEPIHSNWHLGGIYLGLAKLSCAGLIPDEINVSGGRVEE
jgi:hypothetical protein